MNKPEILSRIDKLATLSKADEVIVTIEVLMSIAEWYGLLRTKKDYELLIYNIANNIAPFIYRGVKLKVEQIQ